jgi:hypothetical protein
MSTLIEIEAAVERLMLAQQQELYTFLRERLEARPKTGLSPGLLPPPTPESRARVLAVLAQRFDSGENCVAARHDEHDGGCVDVINCERPRETAND